MIVLCNTISYCFHLEDELMSVIRARTRDKAMSFEDKAKAKFMFFMRRAHTYIVSSVQSVQMIPQSECPELDIDRLSSLAEEESYTMPRGLTREQRREWARKNLEK